MGKSYNLISWRQLVTGYGHNNLIAQALLGKSSFVWLLGIFLFFFLLPEAHSALHLHYLRSSQIMYSWWLIINLKKIKRRFANLLHLNVSTHSILTRVQKLINVTTMLWKFTWNFFFRLNLYIYCTHNNLSNNNSLATSEIYFC